jgi:uncharacterized protein
MRGARVCSVLLPLHLLVAWPAWADPFDAAMLASTEGRHGEAAALFHGLALNGDGVAAYNLALLFATGRGLPQNDREARYWAWRARLSGVAGASALLGRLWPPDDGKQRKAIATRLEADLQPRAMAGEGAAMLQLAVVLETVRETPDRITAHSWQSIAAALDVPGALVARDETLSRLPASERAKAQDKALDAFAEWCKAQDQAPPACAILMASG